MTSFSTARAPHRRAWASRIGALIASAMLLSSGGAVAAVGGGGESTTTTTTSTTSHGTFTHIDLPDTHSYSTRVIGNLNGGSVYDQVFLNPPSSAEVAAGFAAATAAVSSAGGPAVIIGAPTLVSSSDVRGAAVKTGESLNHTETSVTTSTTFGPATILIGVEQSQTFFVDAGTTNVNTNTHTESFIDEFFQSTVTHSATYQITGVLQNIGTVHAAIMSGALDTTGRFLRRLGDVGAGDDAGLIRPAQGSVFADGAMRVWAEDYGIWTRHGDDGSIPGEASNHYGVAAGLDFAVAPDVSLGIAIDRSLSNIQLSGVSEKANVELTQFGANAAFTPGPFIADLAAIYGVGSVDARHGSAALGGVSFGSYDVNMAGVLAEAGYRFSFDQWQVTPTLGLDWSQIDGDAFSETGGIALAANGTTIDRSRAWLGIAASTAWMEGDTRIAFTAYARAVNVLSGRNRTVSASFVSFSTAPLTIQGIGESRTTADLGAAWTFNITAMASLHVAYDGRFGSGFQSHAATLGAALRW